jgi:hypothetical protein
MRRTLAYLVVNLGREVKAKVANKSFPPFMAGETMYAYSKIPLP